MRPFWNHNLHYHPLVLAAVPARCQRALDVGCGEGLLLQALAAHSIRVTGIDTDAAILRTAATNLLSHPNVDLLCGDVMQHPLPQASFDFITAVATLHHLPLQPALARLRTLLKPGGTLAIIGLYRPSTPMDHLYAAVARPTSLVMRNFRPYLPQQAATASPSDTLNQIRIATRTHLPGARLRRHLYFRYSLVWSKPTTEKAG